jgi:hypothetical protein
MALMGACDASEIGPSDELMRPRAITWRTKASLPAVACLPTCALIAAVRQRVRECIARKALLDYSKHGFSDRWLLVSPPGLRSEEFLGVSFVQSFGDLVNTATERDKVSREVAEMETKVRHYLRRPRVRSTPLNVGGL